LSGDKTSHFRQPSIAVYLLTSNFLLDMDCIYHNQLEKQIGCCLKIWNEESILVKCDSELMPDCTNRNSGEEVFQFQTEKCIHCGKKHRSFRLQLRCQILNEFKILAFTGEPPNGTRECPLGIDNEFISTLNLWARFREIILERDSHVCCKCGTDISTRAGWLKEVHHIIPRIEGGGDHPSNLQTLCAECHRGLTQTLLISRMPSTESEWKEWHLNRKFRKGRDMLYRLAEINKSEDV